MSLKDKVEDNVTLWLLGMLLTGFGAGLGTYKAILEIAQLVVVPKSADSSVLSEELRRQKAELDRLIIEKKKIEERNAALVRSEEELRAQIERIRGSRPSVVPEENSKQEARPSRSEKLPPVDNANAQVSPGKVRVTFRDGKSEDYDDIRYMSNKPEEWAFDLYAQNTDAGLEARREFPLANIRAIEFGKFISFGLYHTKIVEVQVELLNRTTVTGWQYSGRRFYLVDKNLPASAGQDLDSIRRVMFAR